MPVYPDPGTPKTWAQGEYPTAAQFNTNIRDASGFLFNPPACRVYNNAAINIATSGVAQALTFNTERYDTDSMHDVAVNTGRITFNTAGLYLVFATVEFAANATGFRQAYIRLNGVTPILVQTNQAPPATIGSQLNVAGVYKFAAADYVECIVQQGSGGALNVTSSANFSPEFGATWVGRG